MKIDGKVETDELIIAEAFNVHFVTKITMLKDEIDQAQVIDPLETSHQPLLYSCLFTWDNQTTVDMGMEEEPSIHTSLHEYHKKHNKKII